MRLISAILTAIITTSFLTSSAFAASTQVPEGCQPLYNGGSFCKNSDVLTINKKVLKPGTTLTPGKVFSDSDFIENINEADMGYPANTQAAFRIGITNTTNASLKNVVVKDVFPPHFLTFVSGSGTYDDATHTFTTTIAELKAKETKQITIMTMTARAEELPTSTAPLCTMNLAIATVNNKVSQDTAQLCVSGDGQAQASVFSQPMAAQPLAAPTKPAQNPTTTKGGLPVASPATAQTAKSTPPTGPEVLVLVGLIPTAGLGLLLRKRA